MSQVGSKLAQVGVMLGQVGSELAQVGPMLAPSWLPLKTIHRISCPTSQSHPQNSMPYPSSWPQVGSMLAHVGSMLAYVGPSGLQYGSTWLQVGPSWLQDAIMLAQVGLKMPKMASNSQLGSMFDQTLLILIHPGSSKYKKLLFYRSVCILHFFVSLYACLTSKLAQVGFKLAQVG